MGVNSNAPAQPFQALPPVGGVGSGITMGNNPNIRGMANAAAQNVANRQQRFMSMVNGTAAQGQPNNYSTEIQQLATKAGAEPTEDYIKAGMLLVDRREEIDAFVDWTLFG